MQQLFMTSASKQRSISHVMQLSSQPDKMTRLHKTPYQAWKNR